jgi:hypothetical protein
MKGEFLVKYYCCGYEGEFNSSRHGNLVNGMYVSTSARGAMVDLSGKYIQRRRGKVMV